MFIPLNLFKTELTAVLDVGDTTLPIPAADAMRLCDALGDECIPCGEAGTGSNFTRLVISYSGYYEIVKVIGCSGNVPILERGDECTTPIKFPIGACVYFIWTAGNLECAIIQVASGYPLSQCEQVDCGHIDLGEGVPGEPGEPGPQGEQGDVGDPGPQGDEGSAGPEGPDGPPGDPGAAGLPGIDGTNGVDGVDGDVGPPGPEGPQGFDGTTGATGPQGAAGPKGNDGVNGDDGLNPYDYFQAIPGGPDKTQTDFDVCYLAICP